MFNKVLSYCNKIEEIDYLLRFGEELKTKYNLELFFIYVKDISRYELIPPALEGLVIDSSTNYIIQEWEKIEEAEVEKFKNYFKNTEFKNNIIIRDGITSEILQEELKGFDLLVYPNKGRVTHDLKTLLRNHYKSIIILPEKKEYSIKKIVFADNLKENSNKSLFSFMNIFEPENIDILSVNIEKNRALKNYFQKTNIKIEFIKKTGDELEEILKYPKDILIMGDLKHSFIYERITGKLGIKLLEKLDVPIFIG